MTVIVAIATVVTLSYVGLCLWYVSKSLNWSGIYKGIIQLLAMGVVGAQAAKEKRESWVSMNAGGNLPQFRTGKSMQGLQGSLRRMSRGLQNVRSLSGAEGCEDQTDTRE